MRDQTSEVPAGRLRPGQLFENHLLLDSLGQASAERREGRTFLAIDTRSLEVDVLSVRQGKPEELRRFLQGQRKFRALELPFVPPMLGGGVAEGSAFAIFKRALGLDVGALRLGGRPSRELASHVLWAATAALASLHAAGYIHGDLHPRNIRIDLRGRVNVVGHFPPPLGGGADLRVGPEARVRRYHAPEDRGRRRPTPAADLWSLGLLALELFLGRPILREATLEEVRRHQAKLCKVLPRVLEKARRRLPRGLGRLLLELLALKPEQRPRDGGVVLDRLLQLLPSPAPPGDAPQEIQREVARLAQAQQRSRIRQARRAAKGGHPLSAAARLVRCTELVAKGQRSSRLKRLLRRVFWAVAATPVDPDGSRAAGLYLVQHAAEKVGDQEVAELASIGLRGCTEPSSAFHPFGAGDDTLMVWGLAVPDLRRALRAEPFDEVPLMALAIHGTPPDSGCGVDTYRALVLEANGLPRQALLYRARSLLLADDVEPELVEIRRLLDQIGSEPGVDEPLREEVRSTVRRPDAEEDRAEADPVDAADEVDEVLSSVGLAETSVISPKPSPEPGRGADAERPRSTLEEVGPEVLFTRGQVMVKEGRLGEAAEVLEQLAEQGVLQQERYAYVIESEFHDLLWRALARGGGEGAEPADEALRRIHSLALRLGMDRIRPLCESLLLKALARRHRDAELRAAVEELLQAAPDSLPLRQAAAVAALEAGEKAAWGRHLVAAAEAFLVRRDLVAATKALQAARQVGDVEGIDGHWGRVMELGAEVAEVSRRFRDLLAAYPEDQVEERLSQVETFLEELPWFEPAQVEALRLAGSLHMEGRFTDAALDLGRKALLREEFEAAREAFRKVVQVEPANDEAALFLASIRPPPPHVEGPVDLLRVHILLEEGLYEAAQRTARKNLRGRQEDAPFYKALVEVARATDADPSPYLVAAGRLALQRRDLSVAREHLEEALIRAREPGAVYASILEVPDLGEVFTPAQLEELRPVEVVPS